MSAVDAQTKLEEVLAEGLEVKTAYANKGMHFILLQKGARLVMASTESINIDPDMTYLWEYNIREITRKPS